VRNNRKAPEIIEETDTYKIVKHGNGGVNHVSKEYADAMSHTVEWALKPTRAAWNEFKKFLQPDMPGRYKDNWEAKALELNNNKEDIICASIGGLYRMPEFWLGVEELSFLPYDDPTLFEEILDTLTNLYITTYTPVLEKVNFDLVYVFEDCCGSSGPLVSPNIYNQFYKKYYRKLTDFFHSYGIKVMMDSDGYIDDLIPCWMDSGIDILFPLEVGKWKASPMKFRETYGTNLRLFGGFNKHAIAKGEKAIRAELEPMLPLVKEGGFIPIPDHKISPECSLQQFKDYVEIFKNIFK
jgi:uroporphyrinogen decarboxylase